MSEEAFAAGIEGGARPLTPRELRDLAQKMVDAKTPEERKRIEKELIAGFYGHAPTSRVPPQQ